jgi:hypothetical protein
LLSAFLLQAVVGAEGIWMDAHVSAADVYRKLGTVQLQVGTGTWMVALRVVSLQSDLLFVETLFTAPGGLDGVGNHHASGAKLVDRARLHLLLHFLKLSDLDVYTEVALLTLSQDENPPARQKSRSRIWVPTWHPVWA